MRKIAKPFVKWAGGKTQLLDSIRVRYPNELGSTINKYAEPFVGGGAVLFDILNNHSLESIYISDINRELIVTYKAIRDQVDSLIPILSTMQTGYSKADDDTRKSIYYANRDRFNELKIQNSSSLEVAALFIFLNRTCFNGLYRVNAKGYFNVPIGSYKNPIICDPENLLAVSHRLSNVQIECNDYRESFDFIDNRTFAYFDPPYRPLSQTSNFTSYTQDGFGDKEQAELANYIDALSEKGAYVVISNSDPKSANANDDFFETLYRKHLITRISAKRMINSSANGRGKISELLIVSY